MKETRNIFIEQMQSMNGEKSEIKHVHTKEESFIRKF